MRNPESEIRGMDETNAFMQAVENFEDSKGSLSDVLERFIVHIAQTGDILAPWEKVQKVFICKLLLVLDEFYESSPYKIGKVNANSVNDDFEEMKKRLLQLTEEFDSPPFTIQRLCELLSEPRKNYTKCDKFMRGVEKNLMVVSSWNNAPRRPSDSSGDRVNGVVGASNGIFSSSDIYKPHWANLPPSPVATTPPKIEGAPDFTTPSPDVSKDPQQHTEDEDSPMQTNEMSPESEESEVKDESSSESETMKPEEETNREDDCTTSTQVEDSTSTVVPANKRKLEEGDESQPSKEDNPSQEDGTEEEEESPTKRAKQDEEHQEDVVSKDEVDQENNDSAQMTKDENLSMDRAQDDSAKSSEGTSFDLEKTVEDSSSVDVQN